jgi:TolB-like protein/Flp pilus assembly protein TadD
VEPITRPGLSRRLKERKLAQWGIAYLSAAFVVFQAVEVLAEPWAIPASTARAIHVLLLVGLPIALVLGWYHGEKGRQRVSGPELIIIAALLFIAGGVLGMLAPGPVMPLQGSATAPSTAAWEARDERPSVAALPFVNMSTDPDDAYLADGLHEEVLIHLARVAGLRVVSRTSVMEYRDSHRSVREIAGELGVGSILEGSVRKVGDRIRVAVQLIDARTDEHLWAETYSRSHSLQDLLDVQAEIASRIAVALTSELTPTEAARLAARRTESLEAYQAFLRGRYYLRLPHYTAESRQRALAEFERAVRLDAGFALAWAELAEAHAQQLFYWTDASEERRQLAREAAGRAIAAGPSDAEVAVALGLYHLWADRDTERALAQIEAAAKDLPDSRDVHVARARVYEVQGRLEEARRAYLDAIRVSPREAGLYTAAAIVSWWLRDYPGAHQFADVARGLAPDQMWPGLTKVLVSWSEAGPSAETAELVADLPPGDPWVTWARYWQALLSDRFEDALTVLEEDDRERIYTKMWATPRPLHQAWALRALGRHEEAAVRLAQARGMLEGDLASSPDDPRLHAALGLTLAGLGERDRAVAAAKRAVALLPQSRDALSGLPFLTDLATTHAILGDEAETVEALRHLLATPSWMTRAWLVHDPRFDDFVASPVFRSVGP